MKFVICRTSQRWPKGRPLGVEIVTPEQHDAYGRGRLWMAEIDTLDALLTLQQAVGVPLLITARSDALAGEWLPEIEVYDEYHG